MKWDGKLLEDVVKDGLYSLFNYDIEKAHQMDNKEYAALLKRKHTYSGMPLKKKKIFVSTRPNGITIRFWEPFPKELDGDNTIEISWSMAARHIRAWEFENNREKPQSKIRQQWDETHLCGDYHGDHCEYLVQAKDDTVLNGKKLDHWCPYCTSENKVRKIGSAGSWTGISPKFCPKRKALENKEDNMARKFSLDKSIGMDMKAASADSFLDNMKMIDFSEIKLNKDNFYELSELELLADDIERQGLKHNLVVSKDSGGEGYWLISGHRRYSAIKMLIEQNRLTSTLIPCYIDGERSQAEAQLNIIMLNATQRKYSDAETMAEYETLKRTIEQLESEGKPVKGRIRELIAKTLNVSPAQVGKIENIRNNAIDDVHDAVKKGDMSISTANEVAKLSPEKQKKVMESKPTSEITHKAVKEIQKSEKTKALSDEDDDFDENELEDDDEPVSDEFDDNELENDDDEPDNDDFDEIKADSKSEKKKSLTLSLILSEDEAKTLLRFFYEFGDNYGGVSDDDAAELREIKSKLKILCGRD